MRTPYLRVDGQFNVTLQESTQSQHSLIQCRKKSWSCARTLHLMELNQYCKVSIYRSNKISNISVDPTMSIRIHHDLINYSDLISKQKWGRASFFFTNILLIFECAVLQDRTSNPDHEVYRTGNHVIIQSKFLSCIFCPSMHLMLLINTKY